jgi:CelD/BcsL family acetyltransferase involved in cellulose biosynthesis
MNVPVSEIEYPDTMTFGQNNETLSATAPRNSASVEIIRDVESLNALRPQWETLVARVPSTVYQSFDWQSLWWKHFGEETNRTLHIVIVRIDGTIAGIIPLLLETRKLFGARINSTLRFLGCGVRNAKTRGLFDQYSPSDFLDAIINPEYARQVTETFLTYLKERAEVWDEMDLDNIADESIFKTELLPLLERNGFIYTTRRMDICPRLDTPASMKDYLGSLSSGVRRRFSQARKIENEGGNASIDTVASAEELDNYFNELIRLHQTRWNKLGYVGAFSDSRFTLFQKDLLRAFYAQGWLWFKRVRMNGATVAVRLGFKFNEKLFDYLSGFSDQMPSSKIRPGLALLLSMIEDASGLGCRSIEFLRGAEAYKFELTSLQSTLWHIHVANSQSRTFWKNVLSKCLRLYDSVRYRFVLEFLTMRVHFNQSRSPLFLIKYFNFRMKKLFQSKG